MSRAAAAVLLLLATFSSHAALVAGPERPVSAPRLGVAGISEVLDVATDGTDFLALWRETTDGPREGLYASIVNEQGVPRPVAPTPLARGFVLAGAVWTGDAYLVIVSSDDATYALRLNREAQAISERVPVDPGSGFIVDVAWNGSRALALVHTGFSLSGMLLDGHGRVLRSGIAIPAQNVEARTMAAAGDAFVVAWADEVEAQQVGLPPLTKVSAVRISSGGDVSAPAELLPPTRATVEMDSASSGNDAGIAFTTNDYREAHRELFRFTIDGPTFTIDAHRKLSLFPHIDELQVVPVSGGFAAAWAFYPSGTLMLGVVRFDALVTRSVAIGPAALIGELRMESNGRTAVAIFKSTTVAGVAFAPDLSRRSSEVAPVSLAWTSQTAPAMASGGGRTLVTWIEAGYPDTTLVAQRRDAAGNPLDAQPIVVARGVTSAPAVTYTGRVWLVAWSAMGFSSTGVVSKVLVQRISPEGALLDAQPVDVGEGWKPALASNGKVAALVMGHIRFDPIRLVRFTPDGEVIDSSVLAEPRPRTDSPAIASNGEELLATWTEEPNNVVGKRLGANGMPLHAAPIAIATGPLSQGGARVASNGTDFVVAYAQWGPVLIADPPIGEQPPTIVRVYTKRVLRNGTLADTTADQDGSLLGKGTEPRITAFGDGYTAAFVDDQGSIVALPLDARGAMLAPPRLVVPRNPPPGGFEIAASGDYVHVAYARLAPELGDVGRVFLRTLTEQAGRRRSARR